MAQQKILLEVVVSDGGTAKIVQKGIEGVGQAADKTTKKTREAGKAQDELNYKLNQGTVGASSAARSFSKLNQAIGAGPNGLVGAYATLAANAFAVSAAFNALREAAQVEQMMKGLEVQGARTGKSLTGLSKELQQLTNYSISAADAMQATALMSSAGFSSKGMKDLTIVANNAALALGRNVPDALDRISKGVTKLEPELLDELGIMTKLTEAQAMYAFENNKSAASLTSFEKRQAMLNAVVAEGTAKFGGLSDQVEANPYDQLAATFSDLTKNVLGFANSVLGPLAKIFGSSQGMLLGGVILFVSSIKKQLMPALFEMSKNAAKARESHLEEAAAIREKTAATLADAKAKRDSALIDARSKTGVIAGAALPKKFRADEIKQGALSVKELNDELNRLNASIRARETGLEGRGAAPVNPAKIAQKKAELELIKQERDNLRNLIDLETKGETDLTPLREAARKGRLEYIAATKLAAMEDKKSQALEAAAAGNLKEGWQKAKEAALEYKRAVAAQGKLERVQADGSIARQGLLSKIGERAQGIAGTAGIFAQTAAAGFMKFLPYIGIATTALSGAWAVYKNFIQSDAEKARIEALKKLKETLDNTAKSVKELTRLNETSVPVGLKAAQTLTIQSNAAAQIASSFKEVQDAAAKAAKGNQVDSFWEALIGSPEDAVAYASGVAKDSAFFKPIADEFTNSTASYIGTGLGAAIGGVLGTSLGPLGTVAGAALGGAIGNKVGVILAESLPEEFNGIDEEAVAAYRSIDQLSRIMRKDLVDSMIAAAGGADNLANSPALRANFIAAADRAYRGVADAVKSLQEAFKQTGVAISDFFKASLKTTPFDSLVQGYQAVNKAFRELDGTLGGSNLTDQIKLLSSMPEEMMRMLDLPQQQLLRTLSEQASKITENERLITQIQQKGEEMTATDRNRLAVLQSENESLNRSVSLYQNQADDIKRSLIASENQYKTLQGQSREYDNQLKLLGAIANANSDIYSKTAEGEKARIQRHNEGIRLQQTQIQIQINIAETYIAQTQNLINQLEVQQTLLQVTKEQDYVSLQAAQRRAQEQKENARAAALAAGLSEQYLQSIERIINNAKNRGTEALVNAAVSSYGNIANEQIQAATTYFNAAKSLEVAATRSANEISINDYTDQIRDFRQNITSMRTEIAALSESQIGSQEEAARIESVRNALLTEQENIRKQIEDINEQVAESARTTLTIERNIRNTIYENIRAKTIEARRRADDAALEAAQNIRRLRSERAITQGRLNDRKNIAQIDRDAFEASIRLLDARIAQEEELLGAKLGQIQADTQLAILQSIIGDGQQQYLEKLQEAVRMREQELSLANSIKDQQLEIAQSAARIRLARAGATPDEKTQKAFEVESAERAYQNALALNEIKMRGIDAEYDLLEARRDIDVAALRTNAYMLRVYDQIFNSGKNSAEIDQLLNTVTEATTRMGRVDFTSMRQNARASQENELTIARQRRDLARAEYEGLYTATTRTQAVIANAAEEFRAIQRAGQIRAEALSSEDKVFTLDLSDQATANRAVVDRLLDIRDSLERIRTTAIPELEQIAEAITGRSSNALADRQAAAAAAVTAAEAAGLRVGEYSARERVAPGSHEDPGHYNATAFDLSGGTRAQIEAQVQAAVLKGATVIWQRQRLTLGSDGQVNRQAYTPGPNAKGSDIYHERHAHISFKNAIESAATAAAPTVTSSTSDAVRAGAQQALAPLLDPKALQARVEEVARVIDSATTVTLDTRSLEEQFDEAFADRIAERENEIVVTAKLQAANDNLSESERRLAQAAKDSAEAQAAKRFDFELFIRAIPRAMEIATTQMEELGTAMSERLGVDFGPEGQVVKSLMSVMTTLSTSMPNTIKVLSQTFTDWQTQNAEAMKGIAVDTQKSIYQAQQLSAAFSAASQVIGSVASLIKSISDAKIASVDREIAAEERRDGKSAASVAKIDALEKKKDAMARKSFNTQKKLMMAQAVMSTAAAVASTYAALAPFGPWVAIPAAAVVGAAGLAQLAIIAGTQYESSYTPKAATAPSTLSIGRRETSVNLAMGPSANAGGELAYVRGGAGTGTSASNYNAIGSAYGGPMQRGYGNRGFVVGEKGPEVITPDTPITVTPANENTGSAPVNATINIQAIDSQGVQDVLVAQKGNIIQMLRQAANASGQRFLEDVNVNVYTRPNVGKLL